MKKNIDVNKDTLALLIGSSGVLTYHASRPLRHIIQFKESLLKKDLRNREK